MNPCVCYQWREKCTKYLFGKDSSKNKDVFVISPQIQKDLCVYKNLCMFYFASQVENFLCPYSKHITSNQRTTSTTNFIIRLCCLLLSVMDAVKKAVKISKSKRKKQKRWRPWTPIEKLAEYFSGGQHWGSTGIGYGTSPV